MLGQGAMSITAVSMDTIVNEEFDMSNFLHKIDNMLIVFYWYKGKGRVRASDYADFPIEEYCFVRFDESDMRVLENDWTMVRDFLRSINEEYEDPRHGYPLLSSMLHDELMFIDTAPKYPPPPSFRFKRTFVDAMVERHFQGVTTRTVVLDGVGSFTELDAECHRVTDAYRSWTVRELMERFGIRERSKSVVERLVIGMFGGDASQMNRIDLFVKAGITVRSLVLSSKGGKTEDMKLKRSTSASSWTKAWSSRTPRSTLLRGETVPARSVQGGRRGWPVRGQHIRGVQEAIVPDGVHNR